LPETLDLAVTGCGAQTPVGLTAPASCAALRAGIARLGPVFGTLVDGELVAGEPAVGGRVPLEWLAGGPEGIDWVGHRRFEVDEPPPPETWIEPGGKRLEDLLRPAAREAWAAAGLQARGTIAWGLYLGLDPADEPAPVVEAVRATVGSRPDVVHVETRGRASALVALRQAAKDFLADRIDVALVGGVDSRIRPAAMEALKGAGALRSASRPAGVLPGEAAAFAVFERTAPPGRRPIARLQSVVTEEEPTAGTSDPNVARGLSRALRRVRLGAPRLSERPLCVCDLNGDRARALEWAMASMRAFADLSGRAWLWHPADCIGDAGAGLGAVNLVWAATALGNGYAPTDRVLVWGASDGPDRAAALLAAAASS
jgi:3-oxoacyl-[acyl-carrier-protein] synthase-1